MRYRAFLSYARADDRFARWLHRALDAYHTPRELIGKNGQLGPIPAKLHPIFRDRTDLEAGGHLADALVEALEQSQALVVLCTPASAGSHWVNRECEVFLRLGREASIFPVIVSGEPDSGDPATECLPDVLRGKGLLAADMREIKHANGHLVGDGKDAGRLKLIAGLLGISLDQLVRRERRRQRRTIALLSSAAAAFALLAAAAGLLGWLAQVRQVEAEISAASEKNAKDQAIASAAATRRTLYETLAAKASLLSSDQPLESQSIGTLRYAMAGLKLAPDNPEPFRSTLANLLYKPQEALKIAPGGKILAAQFTPEGEILLVTERANGGASIWRRSVDGALHEAGISDCAGSDVVVSPEAEAIVVRGEAGCVIDAPFVAPAVRFSPTGKLRAVGPQASWVIAEGGDGGLELWRRQGDRFFQVQSIRDGHGRGGVAISPDGRKLAITGTGGAIYSLTENGAELLGELPAKNDLFMGAAFSPDSSRLATGAAINIGDTLARIFSVEAKPKLIASYNVSYNVMRLSFSRDGSRLLALTMGGAYILPAADTVRGSPIGRFGDPARLILFDGSLSPDGRQAILMERSSSEALLWDQGALGRSVGELSMDACANLGRHRILPQDLIDQEPILRSAWRSDKDLCEGIAPPLRDIDDR